MASLESSDDHSINFSAAPTYGQDGEWSSDSDAGATAAGYTLLLNETDSEDEQDIVDAPLPVIEGTQTTLMDTSDWRPFQTISPEEEERLKREAFAQFDRNYAAEMAAADKPVRPLNASIDPPSVSSAMSSFQLSYRPTWSIQGDLEADDVLMEILKKNNIEWNPNHASSEARHEENGTESLTQED